MSTPKPFQNATVDAACSVLMQKRGRKPRFLVADEVGLGKTVVAQQIIARLAAKNKSKPLVVYYICSSLTIAAQNARKLLEEVESSDTIETAICKADRISMLPFSSKLSHPKVHLYTLTPDTSLPFRSGRRRSGRKDERAIIEVLLRRCWPNLCDDVFKVFPQQAFLYWDDACTRAGYVIDQSLRWQSVGLSAFYALFKSKVRKAFKLGPRQHVPDILLEKSSSPLDLIATLRMALIRAILDLPGYQPDLVIFDEFQRFPDLVKPVVDQDGNLIEQSDTVLSILRGTGRKCRVPLLLLSATPYSLFRRREEELLFGAHHSQLLDLLTFLHGDDKDARDFSIQARILFNEFGRLLSNHGDVYDYESIGRVRDQIEAHLSLVMSRTERAIASPLIGDGDISRKPLPVEVTTEAHDWMVFRHMTERFPERYRSAAISYWRSIPLPMQSMGSGYVPWKQANQGSGDKLAYGKICFNQSNIARNKKFSWPHGKLRALQKYVGTNTLCLPWLPPSMPWWPLSGPWLDPGAQRGKVLLFSRFRATPRVVAAALSHDARVHASSLGRLPKSGASLRLNVERMPVFTLFYPFVWLAKLLDPLLVSAAGLAGIKRDLRQKLKEYLVSHDIRVVKDGAGLRRDKTQFWRLLASLDSRFTDLNDDLSRIDIEQMEAVNAWVEARQLHIDKVSHAELSQLVDHALGAPGVVLARSLLRHSEAGWPDGFYSWLAAFSLMEWRRYFDNPVFVASLRGRKSRYPDSLRRAVVDGNLESVLDEHFWFLRQSGFKGPHDFLNEMKNALSVRGGRTDLHDPDSENIVARCPCDVALSLSQDFGSDSGPEGDHLPRADQVRKAFNSPFWPFVLTTTSVGQEGLDFHPWCQTLVHWDLPNNPVDLEQREGRIQRYAGLSVRRKMAVDYQGRVLANVSMKKSPWTSLSFMVEEDANDIGNGLEPWWCYPGAQVESLFFHLPGSEEISDLEVLKRQRALYRLALGQQHQEDFVRMISVKDPEVIKKLASLTPDLSAWARLKT